MISNLPQVNPGIHARMVADLLADIEQGRLLPGDRLPTETELGRKFGISKTSVRRGMKQLVDLDLVVRQQGSGTYLKEGTARPATIGDAHQSGIARDTVAIIWDTECFTYHPYFSELRHGIEDTLQKQHWNVWRPETAVSTSGSGADLGWYLHAPELVRRELGRRASLAGGIIGGSIGLKCYPQGEPPIPLVVPAANPLLPYVTYDMAADNADALADMLRRNLRNLLAFDAQAPDEFNAMLGRARQIARADRQTAVRHVPITTSRTFTDCIQNGHRVAAAQLEEGVEFDSLMVTSDVHAQGIFDALAVLPSEQLDGLQLMICCSRETRLQTHLRYSRMVIDGYLQGATLVELLDAHIRHPAEAPRHIVLRAALHRW